MMLFATTPQSTYGAPPVTDQTHVRPNDGLGGAILIVAALVAAGAFVIYLNHKFPAHPPPNPPGMTNLISTSPVGLTGVWKPVKLDKTPPGDYCGPIYYVNQSSGFGFWPGLMAGSAHSNYSKYRRQLQFAIKVGGHIGLFTVTTSIIKGKASSKTHNNPLVLARKMVHFDPE
jgi:hypothetical protein